MRRNDVDYARGIAIILIIGHAIGMSEFVVKIIYSFYVPIILFDILIVWVIKCFAPELFEEKRLENLGRQK